MASPYLDIYLAAKATLFGGETCKIAEYHTKAEWCYDEVLSNATSICREYSAGVVPCQVTPLRRQRRQVDKRLMQ